MEESSPRNNHFDIPRGVPAAWIHFYSSNPYEVLGIPRTANMEEVERARRGLMRIFHPDITGGSGFTGQIAGRISAAVMDIKKEREMRQSSLRRPSTQQKREVNAKDFNKRVVGAINQGPRRFKQFVLDTTTGIGVGRLRTAISTEEAQRALEHSLLTVLRAHGCSAEPCISSIHQWKEMGIDLQPLMKRQKIRQLFEQTLRKKILVTAKVNTAVPDDFILPWKNEGVDLTPLLVQQDVLNLLNDAFTEKKKIYGSVHPERVDEFVRSWKTVGVDLPTRSAS